MYKNNGLNTAALYFFCRTVYLSIIVNIYYIYFYIYLLSNNSSMSNLTGVSLCYFTETSFSASVRAILASTIADALVED